MKSFSNEQLLVAQQDLMTFQATDQNPDGIRDAYQYMGNLILSGVKDITIEEFERNGKPSLLAYHGLQRPEKFSVILNGHIDVVPGKPEQFKLTEADGRLYGRGTYDMQLASLILATGFMEHADEVEGLALQIVTDEELAGKDGTGLQVEQGVKGDFVICGDCGRSTAYEIANAAKGVALATIAFKGIAAHGAYPQNGDNPIDRAMLFGARLLELYPRPRAETAATTVTMTDTSTSSAAHNQIPDEAKIKLDARYAPGDPNFQTKDDFLAVLMAIDPNIETDFLDFSPPMYTDPRHPLLLRLKASAEKIERHPFKFAQRNGTSDGRYYTGESSACEFGIAGENQHGDAEYITLEAFKNYRATIHDFLTSITQR